MCGVLIVHSKNKVKLNKEKCFSAAKKLFNRGPDKYKSNFFRNSTLFISNTVLSITGSQPEDKNLEKSLSGNYVISFNGQIYNYKELNNNYKLFNKNNISDTKVLVNLYDKISHNLIPRKLNGMFAYVIFDKKKDKLKIINDPQGEKNLYYYNDQIFFIISSTINAILSFINDYSLNTKPIFNYFSTRHYMPFEETCFKNIKLFPNSSTTELCLKKNLIKTKINEPPLNWISEKKYNKFKLMKEEDVINYFEDELKKQIKLMIPDKNFGCIVSGGIDSSLQSVLISNFSNSKINLVIDHGKKDPIMKNIYQFNKFFKNKIIKVPLNKNVYKDLSTKCYKIISSPMQTHDLPGRLLLSEFFKKNKCKVFFSADGCDELFGGQQIYLKVFSKSYNFLENKSPYSSIQNFGFYEKNKIKVLDDLLKKNWKKVFKKYSFIKSKRERNIQSSLFMDYFFQGTSVANRSNDLISCENSVEPRNAFIQKNILKIILNLPLKYKINEKIHDKKFKQKYILKKIFSRNFNKNLIFPKSGFSGHPNSIKDGANFAKSPILNSLLKIKKKKNSNTVEWKIINSENFLNHYF